MPERVPNRCNALTCNICCCSFEREKRLTVHPTKKSLHFIAIVVFYGYCSARNRIKAETDLKLVTLAHLSDCHIGRSSRHDRMISDLVARLNQMAIDHLVITGDLTDTGYDSEYDKTMDILQKNHFLSSKRLTVIPGNHDLFTFFYRYFHQPSEFRPHIQYLPQTLFRVYRYNWRDYHNDLQKFSSVFAPVFEDTEQLDRDQTQYPFIKRLNSEVALIGLDSNRMLPTLCNNPICAKGSIDLQRLQSLLQQANLSQPVKIAILHHQLLPENRLIEQLGKRFTFAMRLENSDAFVELLRRFDVRMVLHGHYHAKQQYLLDNGRLNVLNNGKTGACSLLRIDKDGIEIEHLHHAPTMPGQ